jgi:hypothetical protein
MRCSCGDANRVGQNRDGDRGERRKTPCSGCVASFLSPALDTCLAPTTEYSSIGIPAPEEAPVPPGSAGVSPAWGWFARQLAIGMVPPRPLGSALEDERISRSGIGRALPWERGRPRPHPGDRVGQRLGFAWLPVALRAPRSGTSASPGLGLAGHFPGSAGVLARIRGTVAANGWGLHGSPSPCGLRARRRAHLQVWDWQGTSLGARASSPASGGPWLPMVGVCMAPRRPLGSALGDERISRSGIGRAPPWERGRPRPHPGTVTANGWGLHGSPSPCGLRARGRAHLQVWDWQGTPLGARASSPASGDGDGQRLGFAWLPVALRAPRSGTSASPGLGLAGHFPGSAGVLARIRGTVAANGWGMHEPPSPLGLRARGRAHLQVWDWQGTSLGARASRPHPGTVAANGWGLHGSPSPCGLRARGRAHLQVVSQANTNELSSRAPLCITPNWQQRQRRASIVSPFQGSFCISAQPRPLAWAGMLARLWRSGTEWARKPTSMNCRAGLLCA